MSIKDWLPDSPPPIAFFGLDRTQRATRLDDNHPVKSSFLSRVMYVVKHISNLWYDSKYK